MNESVDARKCDAHAFRVCQIGDHGGGGRHGLAAGTAQEYAHRIAALRQLSDEMLSDESGCSRQRDQSHECVPALFAIPSMIAATKRRKGLHPKPEIPEFTDLLSATRRNHPHLPEPSLPPNVPTQLNFCRWVDGYASRQNFYHGSDLHPCRAGSGRGKD